MGLQKSSNKSITSQDGSVAYFRGKEVDWYSKARNPDRDIFVMTTLPELKVLDEPKALDLYYPDGEGMGWYGFMTLSPEFKFKNKN